MCVCVYIYTYTYGSVNILLMVLFLWLIQLMHAVVVCWLTWLVWVHSQAWKLLRLSFISSSSFSHSQDGCEFIWDKEHQPLLLSTPIQVGDWRQWETNIVFSLSSKSPIPSHKVQFVLASSILCPSLLLGCLHCWHQTLSTDTEAGASHKLFNQLPRVFKIPSL